MDKRIIGLLFILIFLFPITFADEIELPEGILTPENIIKAQQTIESMGDIQEQVLETKAFIEERTNLLAGYVTTEINNLIMFLIAVIIISNLCTLALAFGIITHLKAKGRW